VCYDDVTLGRTEWMEVVVASDGRGRSAIREVSYRDDLMGLPFAVTHY
jgi:hypothetical protein